MKAPCTLPLAAACICALMAMPHDNLRVVESEEQLRDLLVD